MPKVIRTPEEWRSRLDDAQFAVCRQAATERPFSGRYTDCTTPGSYHCVCCQALLFDSQDKFDAGCGWPSFSRPQNAAALLERGDSSHGMQRVEVLCSQCDAHLGHVFDDGPAPTGLRYCINSVALQLQPR